MVDKVEIAMMAIEVVCAFSCVPAYVPSWSWPVWKPPSELRVRVSRLLVFENRPFHYPSYYGVIIGNPDLFHRASSTPLLGKNSQFDKPASF